jgi:hypothetical protein
MSERENEPAVLRTTIESGRSNVTIPRGIEVLVKKAAVDPEFRELLFEQRGAAAAAIELELDPAENAILSAIPQEQLAQIIGQTTVPLEQRRVFLGKIAVAMLAVLGGGLAGCESITPHTISAGIQPVLPRPQPLEPQAPSSMGIRPDLPPANSPSTNSPSPPPTRGVQPDRP